jgi:hypothetical protein
MIRRFCLANPFPSHLLLISIFITLFLIRTRALSPLLQRFSWFPIRFDLASCNISCSRFLRSPCARSSSCLLFCSVPGMTLVVFILVCSVFNSRIPVHIPFYPFSITMLYFMFYFQLSCDGLCSVLFCFRLLYYGSYSILFCFRSSYCILYSILFCFLLS